jgi:hypothetical protein
MCPVTRTPNILALLYARHQAALDAAYEASLMDDADLALCHREMARHERLMARLLSMYTL